MDGCSFAQTTNPVYSRDLEFFYSRAEAIQSFPAIGSRRNTQDFNLP
jgi:hypothetical protein